MALNYSNPFVVSHKSPSTEVRREGRLCRIVNLDSGASLDSSGGHAVNYMVGTSPNKAVIKNWRVISMGSGHALCAVEDTPIPRYLAPASDGAIPGKLVTLSALPVFWEISRTYQFEKSEDATHPDLAEEWTCIIRWPFLDNEARVLDMEEPGRGGKVSMQPFRQQYQERSQFWRIQFLDEAPAYTSLPYTPLAAAEAHPTLDIESGAKYIIQNVKGSTVITQSLKVPEIKTLFGRVCDGNDGQKWEVINRGKGWVLKNVQNRHFMSIAHDPRDSVDLINSTYDGVLWDIRPQEYDDYSGKIVYSLVLRGTDYVVTLGDLGNSTDRTRVVLWRSWNGPNQLWKFDRVG